MHNFNASEDVRGHGSEQRPGALNIVVCTRSPMTQPLSEVIDRSRVILRERVVKWNNEMTLNDIIHPYLSQLPTDFAPERFREPAHIISDAELLFAPH